MGRKSSLSVGDKIGAFTILEVLPTKSGNHSKAIILCDFCGEQKKMSSQNIKNKNSCGCQQRNSSGWKNNSGAYNKTWQLPLGEAAKNNLYYQYKKCAEKRKYAFDFTKEEFCQIVIKPCHYCGSKCQSVIKGQGKTSGDFYYTGVDRWNNSIGYNRQNCVPCCKICNSMKNTLSEEEFLSHIKQILSYLGRCSECVDAPSITIE